MKKKIITVLLATIIAFVGLPVSTEASTQIRWNDTVITPYYTYLSLIGASLTIDGGYATCYGSLDIYHDYATSITLTLQQSSNGVTWSNIKSWSQDFTGIGTHYLEKNYFVNSGYQYRVMNVAKVKNGSTVLETATVYSLAMDY